MTIYTSSKVLPYVYRLVHRITGQFYIGYRESNGVPSDQDIGIIYKSSSKHVLELGFENFECEVIAEFFDGNDAYRFENDLIGENFSDPLCLNKHYTTKELKRRFKHVIPHSNETKQLISEKIRQMPASVREAIASKLRGKKRNPIAVEKMRTSMMGHLTSDETKTKICDALRGEKHHQAKIWTIQEEKTGKIFEIKSLSSLCGHNGINTELTDINRTTLIRNSAKGKFYKGYKIIASDKKN
jgi:hypothetical protein